MAINIKTQALILSKCHGLSLEICGQRYFTNGTLPLFKKKDIFKADKLPIFDYSRINLDSRRLYVFGAAFHGGLGLRELIRPQQEGNRAHLYMQKPVRHKFGYNQDLRDIATGHGFTLIAVARKDQNHPAVFGCGMNAHSQLGYQAARSDAPMTQLIAPAPLSLPFRSERPHILAIAAGRGHSLISAKDEGLMIVGDNSKGQCGRIIDPKETYFGSRFVHRVSNIGGGEGKDRDEVISMAARFDLSLCVTKKGKVYAFGDNSKGQLGRGKNIVNTWALQSVGGIIENEVIVKVATNGTSVLAINDKGELFGWGCNEVGHLEPKKYSRVFFEPISITLRGIGKLVDIAIGDKTTHVVNEEGYVYAWGEGPALGLGPGNKQVQRPTLMPPPLFGCHSTNTDVFVSGIVSGLHHAAAVTNKGDLYTWGKNAYGCLGLGDINSNYQLFPFKVALNGMVIKAAIGLDHTIVLTKGGF